MATVAKRPLTPDEINDSDRLRAIWERYQAACRAEKKSASQEWLGKATELGSQGLVWQYMNRVIPLNVKALAAFSRVLGVPPEEISPRLAPALVTGDKSAQESGSDADNEFAMVRRLDVKASAGKGKLIYIESEKSRLAFRHEFLAQLGVREANAVILYAEGSSMEPTIPDGSVVLVNMGDTAVKNNGIYVVQIGDDLCIKRIQKGPHKTLLIVSDNEDKDKYPTIELGSENHEGVQLKGRAVWMGARL